MNKFGIIAGLVIGLCTVASGALAASAPSLESLRPRFVGLLPGETPVNQSTEFELSFAYMTASEMQSKVRSLTGYLHPAFDIYADVLGRFDPRTGLRTNDRPSLVTIFFMQKIADTLATAVIEREIFLDDAERIVYQGVDLAVSPSEGGLASLIESLYGRWIGQACGPLALAEIEAGFRREEGTGGPVGAYRWLTGMMIRHGGLYYY